MEPLVSGDLTLREYKDSDFEAVHKLYRNREVMKYAGGVMRGDVLRLIIARRPKTDIFLVKEIKGEFAGTSLLERDLRERTTCWLTAVNTLQGSGISTRALPLMMGLAKTLGMNKVCSIVHKDNLVGKRLFEAADFDSRASGNWIIYEKVID